MSGYSEGITSIYKAIDALVLVNKKLEPFMVKECDTQVRLAIKELYAEVAKINDLMWSKGVGNLI